MEKLIGKIGIDAGMCWVGDPSYILPNDASERPGIWKKLITLINNKSFASINYKSGAEGAGVCVTSGYGDGFYSVYADIQDDIVHSIKVVFVEDD
jgi:hypothetical protein